jgi:hypothetical protein
MRVRAGREVEKTLNAALSRRPQKSRRRDVKFALRYARDSRAGEGRSVIRLVSSAMSEGRCSTYWWHQTGSVINWTRCRKALRFQES